MYKEKSVLVVIPCYNEGTQIGGVLDTLPAYVDHVVVVDDGSKDDTAEVVGARAAARPSIILLRHERNQGVGAAMATGYKHARSLNPDVVVSVDGDGQMEASDIVRLIVPVLAGEVDFTKANRLYSGEAFRQIPRTRYYGNAVLSLLTKVVSGYWHIADSQSGFTAFNKRVLDTINWDKLYKKYGRPNDLLILLNISNFRVRDIPTRPVYNVGERSSMKISKVVFSISWLLIRRFFFRMKEKYIIRDSHPLVFFYFSGFMLLLVSIPLFVRLLVMWISIDHIPKVNFLAWMFSVIMGIQFVLFAMWFDMDNNKHLR
jgi:glycosyltransferase involved in cell wall biosynthesis